MIGKVNVLTVALVLTTTLLGVAMLAAASPARAQFEITSFDGSVTDAHGAPANQAGEHPYMASTTLTFTPFTLYPVTEVTSGEAVKFVHVDLPLGFVGNPSTVPQCTEQQLSPVGASVSACPASSQIGNVVTTVVNLGFPLTFTVGLYNMVPLHGSPATFGFNVNGVPLHMVAHLRPKDQRIGVDVDDISQKLFVTKVTANLWGVPADPSHDADRLCPGSISPCSTDAPVVPLLTNPTSCDGPVATVATAASWQHPETHSTMQFLSHDDQTPPNPLGVVGCDTVPFNAEVVTTLDTTRPDAPVGMRFGLEFPSDGILSPSGLSNSALKDARVVLPEGLTINPASAGGLVACADEDLRLGSDEPVTCPEAAKIGTVIAATPLLNEKLSGGIYIRSQASSDPASGEMFRMALVLENAARGLSIRLPGQVHADPSTGRLAVTFDNNPQLPVSNIDLQFKSGPRAPLATPTTCGEKTIDVHLTSWSGQSADLQSKFTVDCTAGLGGLAPSFSAGTTNPVAGGFSPFSLSTGKPDGDEPITGLSMSLPTGLLAHLKGNLGTQVGTVKAYAGPGSNPFVLPGQVYLEGAYENAPFSLKVVVPAKAGPFDLGEVVVRQKIYVDPIDAHVTVVSDPIPTIVKGVPVRLQRLEVDIDKPGFVINPTSCAAKTITATLSSATGQSVPVTNRFQVGSCALLALKPSLGLSLSGKGQTTDGKHPAVTAVLSQPFGGQANLKKVRVALPLSLALDPDNANGLCEFADGSKVTPTCPKASIVGTATATTPILDESLSGPVYFVKNIRKDAKTGREIRTLPKLVIPLTGQNGVKLTLTGTSDVVDDQLVSTFDNIPDAPVSSFKMNINGGKGGILTVSGADICKATQIADQQIDGQNNKNADADVYIQTPSCPLKVLSKKVGKSSVAVKVGGLGAGKVTVTGRGIRKTTKTIAKSTVATVTARRTRGRPGKVTVSFDPTGPAKARKTTK